jgi:hypothetical protein
MIIHSVDLFKPKIGRCKQIRALSRWRLAGRSLVRWTQGFR